MSQKLKVSSLLVAGAATPLNYLKALVNATMNYLSPELWLVDVEGGEEEAAGIIYDLCQRVIDKAGVPLKLCIKRWIAGKLKDANFVTTQLRVGQLKALRETGRAYPA